MKHCEQGKSLGPKAMLAEDVNFSKIQSTDRRLRLGDGGSSTVEPSRRMVYGRVWMVYGRVWMVYVQSSVN